MMNIPQNLLDDIARLQSDLQTLFASGQVPAPAPAPVTAAPAPPPLVPGHEVTEDPDFSATTRATVFGLNYNGSNDTGDLDHSQPDGNGKGFFIDPATGAPYVTHVKSLAGASLPREVLLSTFLGVDAWVQRGIETIWSQYASDLRDWVLRYRPSLDIDSHGDKTVLAVPLVDAGPAADTHNGLDLTYLTAHDLDTQGAASCTYRVMLGGKAQQIRGWDFVRKRVIGS